MHAVQKASSKINVIIGANKNRNLFIRMPNATRPWQHVLEPIFGYISLAEKLFKDKKNKFSGAWNFAPSLKNNLKVFVDVHIV